MKVDVKGSRTSKVNKVCLQSSVQPISLLNGSVFSTSLISVVLSAFVTNSHDIFRLSSPANRVMSSSILLCRTERVVSVCWREIPIDTRPFLVRCESVFTFPSVIPRSGYVTIATSSRLGSSAVAGVDLLKLEWFPAVLPLRFIIRWKHNSVL